MLVITQHLFYQRLDHFEYGVVSASPCQREVKFKVGIKKAGHVVAAAADSLDGFLDMLEVSPACPRGGKLSRFGLKQFSGFHQVEYSPCCEG